MNFHVLMWEHPYYDPRVLGVYSSLDKVNQVIANHKVEWREKEGRYYEGKRHKYHITRHTVDE